MVRLKIYTKDSVEGNLIERCTIGKWDCIDKMMGENRITFNYESPIPIDFQVGDWCVFRGETYRLNVKPSCIQKAKPNTHGGAFVYDNVTFDSGTDDLTRCTILDILPTSGEHSAAYGTNYTGSAVFSLNCFETTFESITYAPVHALLDRIKANLDRLYPEAMWQYIIDDSKCHTDDYIISFNNWTATQALAEVHNTFKLDFVIRGRYIVVGDVSDIIDNYPELQGLVGYVTDFENNGNPIAFGYGMGYLTSENKGKSLFQIKKNSKTDQQIITRLRAVGSTKNMPYRYYHKHYTLPQTMFVHNLQLPDTFVPYDSTEDPDASYYKIDGNTLRDDVYGKTEGVPNVRHVLGASNDAYIDKGDDATSCPEGVREGTARWDGTDSELPEIYPTIEESTYGELRANNVADVDGTTGNSAFPNYGKSERIDEILAVGDDCNIGDGVMTDNEAFGLTSVTVPVALTSETIALTSSATFNLFTIDKIQEPGDYLLSYTTQQPYFKAVFFPGRHKGSRFQIDISLQIYLDIIQVSKASGQETTIATYTHNEQMIANGTDSSTEYELLLPDFHNTEETPSGWNINSLTITDKSTVKARLRIISSAIISQGSFDLSDFKLGLSIFCKNTSSTISPNAIWEPSSSGLYYSTTPFTIMLKDMGIDFTKISALDDGDITISMKSGQCGGREFVVKPSNIATYVDSLSGKKGWKLTLDRVTDDSIHAYFPSENSKIMPGDHFVLLNIELPDAYIKAAETRLLIAATQHLADNDETKYTYQPYVDDIYLQRNIDFNDALGTPEKSVFWRLRSGMKFLFYGIPDNVDAGLPLADITIEQVVIKMGEKVTPQVELTLNDDVEQGMIQKMQTTVDRIYGSVFNTGGGSGVSAPFIREAMSNFFLSKINNDEAQGKINFLSGISTQAISELAGAIFSDYIGTPSFFDDFTGSGWRVNANGDAVFNSITVRGAMRAYEMLIQKVRATGGEIIVSAANGRVKSATLQSGGVYNITLENDDDNFGNMFLEHDFVLCQKWDKSKQTIKRYWGFVSSVANNVIAISKHYFADCEPEAGDELVLFGSTNIGRRSAITISATDGGTPKITVLDGIKGENVWSEEDQRYYAEPSIEGCTRAVLGDLSGITDADMGTLEGYGLYSDNVYLKGKLALSNGTLISDELTDIKSGKIHLSGETTVDNDFYVRNLETIPTTGNARVSIKGSLMEVYGTQNLAVPNIRFGVDETTGSAVMQYYDNYGVLIYDLGPNGINFRVVIRAASFTTHHYVSAAGSGDDGYHQTGAGATGFYIYSFSAKRYDNRITGDDTYISDPDVASFADGKYLTTDSAPIAYTTSGSTITLTNAVTRGKCHPVNQPVHSINDDIRGIALEEAITTQAELTEFVEQTIGTNSYDTTAGGTTVRHNLLLANDIYYQKCSTFSNGVKNDVLDIWQ